MRVLFYLLPALINIIAGLFFFISAKRMADINANSFLVAATLAVWAACYGAAAFVQGYVLTKRNAVKFLLAGQAVLLISLLGLLLFPAAYAQYLWLPGTGIGCAMFFTPFQAVVNLFGKAEHTPEAVAKNTAFYTFSWSFGLASGPLAAAFVWGLFSPEHGWKYCYGFTILAVLFIMRCLGFMNRHVKARLAESDDTGKETPAVPGERTRRPDLMIAAWGLGLLSYSVIEMMRTYIPDYCTKHLILGVFEQGAVLAVIGYAQAFAALACRNARRWPYHPWVVGTAALCGAAAMSLFAFSSTFLAYLLAAGALGTFSGIFCFTLTFHALIDPAKTAKYASVNETLVGGTAMFAPLLGGALAMRVNAVFPFHLCAALLALGGVFFAAMTWRLRHG